MKIKDIPCEMARFLINLEKSKHLQNIKDMSIEREIYQPFWKFGRQFGDDLDDRVICNLLIFFDNKVNFD